MSASRSVSFSPEPGFNFSTLNGVQISDRDVWSGTGAENNTRIFERFAFRPLFDDIEKNIDFIGFISTTHEKSLMKDSRTL